MHKFNSLTNLFFQNMKHRSSVDLSTRRRPYNTYLNVALITLPLSIQTSDSQLRLWSMTIFREVCFIFKEIQTLFIKCYGSSKSRQLQTDCAFIIGNSALFPTGKYRLFCFMFSNLHSNQSNACGMAASSTEKYCMRFWIHLPKRNERHFKPCPSKYPIKKLINERRFLYSVHSTSSILNIHIHFQSTYFFGMVRLSLHMNPDYAMSGIFIPTCLRFQCR